MAYFDTTWYCNAGDQSTTGYYAVAKRASGAAVVAGQLVRQFTAPAVGSERVFVCRTAGTTAVATDATWVITRGSITNDGTAVFQECTGVAAMNGDVVNTLTWDQVKAQGGAMSLGAIIKRNNGVSYQIATSAGTVGTTEPAFSDVAGTLTADGGTNWRSLGPVGNFVGGGAPHARLVTACTGGAGNWFAPGNTVYVGNNHAESQSTALTITTVGNTSGAIARVLCHTASGPYPPTTTTTGASVTVTANTISITLGGSLYVEGVAFKPTASTNTANFVMTSSGATANQAWAYYKNCSFQLTGTASGSYMQIAPTVAGYNGITFDNCTVKFGAATQYMFFVNGQFVWKNTGPIFEAGSVVPTSLIYFNTVASHDVVLEALDLSQLAGNVIGFPVLSTGGAMGNVLVKDCKLSAAGTIATALTTGYTVQLVRSSAQS